MKILIKFDRTLIFQGFEMILESDFNDFIKFKNDKNVDFSMFYRSHYRTQNGNRRVDRRDMPFPAIEHLFKNVNYAPL